LCRKYRGAIGNCARVLTEHGIFPIERDPYGNHAYPRLADDFLAALVEKQKTALDRLKETDTEPAVARGDSADGGGTYRAQIVGGGGHRGQGW
jgi:hypothetical protein